MGRYLALGLGLEIAVRGRNEWLKENHGEKVNKIKRDLGEVIDIENYTLLEEENSLKLEMKSDYFDKHIHSLLKELDDFLSMSDFVYRMHGELVDLNEDFNMENHPIHLVKLDERYNYENEHLKEKYYDQLVVKYNDDFTLSDIEYTDCPFYEASKEWMFDQKTLRNINLGIDYFNLWIDYNKIDIEDETNMLMIMNVMLRNMSYKNPLFKNLFFYISG